MELNLHEWGDPAAPPVVCLHGVNAHGRRFRKLAEERLARRYRVLAPDLRGHGTSGWEPPWTFATHAHDVLETLDAAGVQRAFVAYDDSVMHDLITKVSNPSGWTLQTAVAVNANGWIVGSGIKNGYNRAFVLAPNQ